MEPAGRAVLRPHRVLAGTTPGRLSTASVTVVVQVDGLVRGRVHIGPDRAQADVLRAAIAAVGDVRPSRVVYVPGRVINLVTSPPAY